MSDFEQPISIDLELSQEEIVECRDYLAKILILKGRPTEARGVHATDDHKTPYTFTYPLDSSFLNATYFPDDDIIVEKGYAEYNTPHRLEENDSVDETAEQSIFVHIATRLNDRSRTPADQIVMDVFYNIGGFRRELTVPAYRNVEYSQNGRTISPNNFEPKDFFTMDDGEIRAFFEDQFALRGAMTLDDFEKLRKIGEYIQAHPKID